MINEVNRLLWPGNSPDFNAIEKAWPWMKKVTTRRGAASSKNVMAESWQRHWCKMKQEDIQKWVEGVPENIKRVIELEGGNEYQEGRNSKRSYKGRRRIGELFKHSFIVDESGDGEDYVSDDEFDDIEQDEEEEDS